MPSTPKSVEETAAPSRLTGSPASVSVSFTGFIAAMAESECSDRE